MRQHWITLSDSYLRCLNVDMRALWEAVGERNFSAMRDVLDDGWFYQKRTGLQDRGLRIVAVDMSSRPANNLDSVADYTLAICLERET